MALKILFLSHSFAPALGGIEASSLLIATALTEAGHQVRLMTYKEGENSDFTYKVIRNPSFTEIVYQHSWADIVYENNPCLRLGWPKLLFCKPSIVALHTWITREDGSLGLADRLKFIWLSRANKVIAISKALQDRCWPKAIIINNSYDNRLFNIRPGERKNNFVFLGRLVSDKGVQLAIQAFIDMKFINPIPGLENSTLTIIGSGPDMNELKHSVSNLPDRKAIKFIGPQRGEALVIELNKHSFQFIPSTWEEPFGIVALEGIACGLIPIASNGGGLPDAVGKAGVTFERGDVTSLIATTTALLNSPEKQNECRLAATNHLAKFNKEVISNEFVALIEEISKEASVA